MFCKKSVLRNLAKFKRKHLHESLFLNNLRHRCFPVNFVKFLGTPFYTEHLWWLLLNGKGQVPSKFICDTSGDLVLYYYLRNVKNTNGGVLLLVKLQTEAFNFTKSNTPRWVFFYVFLNCASKYRVAQSVSYLKYRNIIFVVDLNLFQVNPPLAYLLKASENQVVFRGI